MEHGGEVMLFTRRLEERRSGAALRKLIASPVAQDPFKVGDTGDQGSIIGI